jgi:hypothetical protein
MADKTGYKATLTVGSYTGVALTNVSVRASGETIDVSDLSSYERQKQFGKTSWELTGSKNLKPSETTTVMGIFFPSAAAAQPSVGVSVKNPTGTCVFSGTGYVTRAVTTYPMGAATQEFTVVNTPTSPSVPTP